MGMGWKSLRGVILRAPLCGANNVTSSFNKEEARGGEDGDGGAAVIFDPKIYDRRFSNLF